MDTPTHPDAAQLRAQCIEQLQRSQGRVPGLRAFLGLDGFVDEIIHVVDKRDSAEQFQRIPSIGRLAERIAAAAGRSTNIELVTRLTKLGGNGPIMANALVGFGMRVTYLGALGYPCVHPVFEEFTRKAEVHTLEEPGHTDALEFEDGKIMLGKSAHLGRITWAQIQERFGRERFEANFRQAELIAFVNWTMIPHMSDIWEALQRELCPALGEGRRLLFVDLADPEKRQKSDLQRALRLVSEFNRHFQVILGVNEKEAHEVASALDLQAPGTGRQALCELARSIYERVPMDTLVVHPVSYALTVQQGRVDLVDGPFIARPTITTGAGDHFNSGFCLGRLLGMSNALSLLCGVSTSGYYVRSASSPGIPDLVELLTNWPGPQG